MVSPKFTEDTVTVMLKEELSNQDINVIPFATLNTPSGIRKPDLYCQNGGKYVIEAKIKEEDLPGALSKIYDSYLKYSDLLGLRGGFAILYPEELANTLSPEEFEKRIDEGKFVLLSMFASSDPRTTQRFVGTFSEVSNYISNQILYIEPVIEPDVNFLIKVLRDCTKRISKSISNLPLEDFLNVFGGKNVFTNILEYKEHEIPKETVMTAAPYLLINQLLFYEILSGERPQFESLNLDYITSPSDLSQYFAKVLDENYATIFSFDIASKIPISRLDDLKSVVGAIQSLYPRKLKHDLLGTIFHNLIPFKVRKKVAAFYTNIFVAELLSKLAIGHKDSKVADFASGSGGLVVAAYQRKKSLMGKEYSAAKHAKFIEEDLFAVDVMPFAAHLTSTHLALQAPSFLTDHVNVGLWDSTELSPGAEIPPIADLHEILKGRMQLDEFLATESSQTTKGVVALKVGQEVHELKPIKLVKVDTILMNPPFTRQERMDEVYKNLLMSRFPNEYIHGQMGFYSYFILLADRFLKKKGNMGLVLPAAFLVTRSSLAVRNLLIENYQILYIISNKELNFSESTWRREILLIARKSQKKSGSTQIITLNSLPQNSSEVDSIIHEIQLSANQQYYLGEYLTSALVPSSELMESTRNWFGYIALDNAMISKKWYHILEQPEELVSLKDFLAEKHAGIIRGLESTRGMKLQKAFILSHNSRARRREDRWVVNRIIRKERKKTLIVHDRHFPDEELKIPFKVLNNSLRSLSGLVTIDLKPIKEFVIIDKFRGVNKFFEGDRNLIKVLPQWKEYVLNRKGRILFQRRFVLPAPGTYNLAYYSQEPLSGPGTGWIVSGLDAESAKILCLWFNSTLNFLQILFERIEDVWIDLHQYLLVEMKVLDIKKIKKKDKKRLLALFKEFSQTEMPSIIDQYRTGSPPLIKQSLDRMLLNILGYNSTSIESELNELYLVLGEILERFEEQMPGE
ncbi:MAG: Eco57I restriction-modification methylase domain-containing protein [Candidatus Hodarchaeota archaeon]